MDISVGDTVRLNEAHRWHSVELRPHVGRTGTVVAESGPCFLVRFSYRGASTGLSAPTWWFLRPKYLTQAQ